MPTPASDTPSTAPDTSRCPGCGAPNGCAIAAGLAAADCWCMTAPRALPVPNDATSCWCPRCLQRLAEAVTTPPRER